MKKLKRFFKSLNAIDWMELILAIVILMFSFITLFKFLFIGKTEVKSTPVGNYTCSGGIIKICGSSSEVSDYLGV